MSALLPVYRRSDITMVRGEGVYLFSEDGARYLDFASGMFASALGHCHPALVKALQTQAATLWHCSNMYRHPELERLAARFAEQCFADKVFFCNSGSEAVECGLKMVRKYFSPTLPSPSGRGQGEGDLRRYRVITMTGGFHGRSLACISAGGNDIARKGYEPLVDGFDRVEFNNLNAVEAAIGPQTAAILVEPVQGEGGIRVATKEFMQGLRALCDAHGLLLFIDEVQCGMGRTGALFTHEQYGVTPDIVSAAKGIGNGFPLAACFATDKAASAMSPGTHGSTYGGNPLAMVVGNAVLDIVLADGFFKHVEAMGALFKKELKTLAARYPALIEDVRGMGLMLGLKLRVPPIELVTKLREHGLLASPAEDSVMRLMPPLVVEEAHIEEAMDMLTDVCEAWIRPDKKKARV